MIFSCLSNCTNCKSINNTHSKTTLGKLLEMFSEITSSPVTYFWFIRCSVSLLVVLLLTYVFVVVLFHGIKPAHHLFRMNNVTWLLAISLNISATLLRVYMYRSTLYSGCICTDPHFTQAEDLNYNILFIISLLSLWSEIFLLRTGNLTTHFWPSALCIAIFVVITSMINNIMYQQCITYNV